MAKHCMLMLLLAVQGIASSGAVVRQGAFRTESNLRLQSNSSMMFTFSQAIWNNTISNLMVREVEMQGADPPKVNKCFWALFALVFGCCGCDRCFMGQVLLGILKGCTFGGFLVWHMIDYFVCLVSCVSKEKKIQMVGYNAVFEESSIEGAFYMAITFFILQIIFNLRQIQTAKAQQELQQQSQENLLAALGGLQRINAGAAPADIPRRHQSLAYIPTALSKGLRSVGLVQEKPTIPELIAAFEKMDKDGDGQLDREEMKAAMSAMGTSDETIDEMIKAADTDGDGKISKNEFLISMTQKEDK